MLWAGKIVCSLGELTRLSFRHIKINRIGHRRIVLETFCQSRTHTMSAVKWPQVFLFGDSLTQRSFSPDGCWGSLLADALQRKCDVLSRGLSGYNSRWCYEALPRILTKEEAVNIVTMVIFLGANDSTIESARQHVPREEYQQNLVKMINYAKSVGISADNIVLVGPPPCVEEKWAAACVVRGLPMVKDNSLVGAYSEACESAAKQCSVTFLELYSTMMKEKNWSRFMGDGLHFSQEGSEFVYSLLGPLVQERTAHLPMILPYWADIDQEDPAKTLLA